MNRKTEARVLNEIRQRAFERADRMQEERQHLQMTQWTLNALQEVTGLPRPELESIANAAKRSFQTTHAEFFSIKRQLLIAGGISGLILIFTLSVAII